LIGCWQIGRQQTSAKSPDEQMTKPAREKTIADPKNLVDVTLLTTEDPCF
jgi:hypothetical protein